MEEKVEKEVISSEVKPVDHKFHTFDSKLSRV